jgi:hypothetical protein
MQIETSDKKNQALEYFLGPKKERQNKTLTRSETARKRQKQGKIVAKILESLSKKDYAYALNSFRYFMEEFEGCLYPEEKAQYFEEMGRLCLKLKRHPNEACHNFRLAVFALGVLDDKRGICELVETYNEKFQKDDRTAWIRVLESAKELYCQ